MCKAHQRRNREHSSRRQVVDQLDLELSNNNQLHFYTLSQASQAAQASRGIKGDTGDTDITSFFIIKKLGFPFPSCRLFIRGPKEITAASLSSLYPSLVIVHSQAIHRLGTLGRSRPTDTLTTRRYSSTDIQYPPTRPGFFLPLALPLLAPSTTVLSLPHPSGISARQQHHTERRGGTSTSSCDFVRTSCTTYYWTSFPEPSLQQLRALRLQYQVLCNNSRSHSKA